MKNRSLKYIFGILLSSVLVVTGCGSSSSNNPVSNGSINSGLVSVNGNVKNLEGNGTVSFYTPSAVYTSNLNENNSFRASVANDGIYTFNVDENGNYAGQIPEGDYYIIAQNSDGSMKYASAKQNFSASARAETSESNSDSNIVTVNFQLAPTKTIEGILTTSSELVKGQYVYIENLPFVTVTGSYGNFVFKDVPVSDDTNYTICSNIWVGDTRYKFFTKDINKEIIEKETTLNLCNFEPISISGVSQSKVTVKISSSGVTIKNIMAVTNKGEILAALPDYSYLVNEKIVQYILPLSSNADVKMLAIKTGDGDSDSDYKIVKVVSEMLTEGENTIICSI